MTVSISIDPADQPDSDLSSLSEDEGSGVHVTHPSNESHEYLPYEDGWALPFPDELKPSDSASRPRTSHRPRSLHGRSVSGRRQPTRRPMNPDRDYASHTRRHSPESPGSADSEDYPQQFARAPQDRRWPQAGGRGYPQSVSSGSYNHPFAQGHAPFPHQNGPSSDQLIPMGHTTPNGQPFPPPGYPYGPHNGHPMHHAYYQEQAHPRHHQQPPQSRMDPHGHQPLPPHMAAHGVPSPYGGPPFPHELMSYNPNNFYNGFREPYGMYPGMMHPSYFPYPPIQPAAQPEPKSPPAPAADDAAKEAPKEAAPAPTPDPKDDAIARLEKLILDERLEREAKEAARLAAIEAAAAEKAAREKQLAHDRAIAEAAASEAATLARADAEARAKEDAAKAKEEAEKAAADAAVKAKEDAEKAATDAATKALEAANLAATKAKEEEEAKNRVPPPEKKKPIKFKDAVGRKFSFPFELCATWQGMEDLIKQAFLHIEVIGPHVAEGHYDLVGPNGDIILPQVWETVVEPDWTITMHMWPIPEKPKEPDPPPPAEEAPPAPPKPAPDAKKKEAAKKAPSPAFANWVMGRRVPPRAKKAAKVEKKDEPAPQ